MLMYAHLRQANVLHYKIQQATAQNTPEQEFPPVDLSFLD
jgi:hypothetical protein